MTAKDATGAAGLTTSPPSLVFVQGLKIPPFMRHPLPSHADKLSPPSTMQSIVPARQQSWMPSSENDCCQMCRSFFDFVARQQTGRIAAMIFHNIQQLKESSENGCHMCILILLCITAEQQRRYLEELERASEGEPQFVAVVGSYNLHSRTTPSLRIEEAYPRPPVCNRVTVCKLKCEIPTDEHELSTYDCPLLHFSTYVSAASAVPQASTALYRLF